MWQDYAITVIQFALAGAMLPALLGKEKPDRITCGLNGGLLVALAGIFATLDLLISAGSAALVALCWWVLLFQTRKP